MAITDVENLIVQLTNVYQEKIGKDSSITSIYLYGSYIRGDFVLGKSDLNFAIFLDIPNNEKIQSHPDLSYIKYISENIINIFSNTLFRASSGLSKFMYTVYTLNDLRKIIRNEATNLIDSEENLTFLAFDFLKNNKLLYGRDVLKDFEKVPDPMIFKENRFKIIKEKYFLKKEKGYNAKMNLILTVGNLILYYAVIEGVRDISRKNLFDWSENYPLFTQSDDFKEVIEKYFLYYLFENFTQNNSLNDEWMKKAENFVEEIFNINWAL